MSTAAAPSASADPFQALDDSKISKFQIKTMFVSGMGFFTDAYDLFVIGIVVSILKTQWSLTTTQVSWLNSATLLARHNLAWKVVQGPQAPLGVKVNPAALKLEELEMVLGAGAVIFSR